MPAPLIRDTPKLEWAAAQTQTVRLTLTPRDGLVLADYGTFTLTIRRDPLYPRSGPDLPAADTADPLAKGWEVAASAEGEISGSVVLFAVDVPAEAGRKRYVVDVVAEGGTAGRVQVVDVTWLSVLPTLRAAS